jgi:hypothetical protein
MGFTALGWMMDVLYGIFKRIQQTPFLRRGGVIESKLPRFTFVNGLLNKTFGFRLCRLEFGKA